MDDKHFFWLVKGVELWVHEITSKTLIHHVFLLVPTKLFCGLERESSTDSAKPPGWCEAS